MDVGAIRDRIRCTLDANTSIRQQAELDLKAAEDQAGFTDALLNILEAEQDLSIRQSCAVYFKNRIMKGWAPSEFSPANPLPEGDKPAVRNRLVPITASSSHQVRSQLLPALQHILHYDFPTQWPDFFNVTTQLLNANDAATVFAGIFCLLSICRVYRFKNTDNRADFDKVVEMTFPQLLRIGNGLVAETSLEAGDMLRTVMKAFKHAAYLELPTHLRDQQVMVSWCTLFLRTVSKETPSNSMHEDLAERESSHWWKAKARAYANVNRLFTRYGNPTSLSKGNGEEYAGFASFFIDNFAPEILKTYLGEVEKWITKRAWLSKACLYRTIEYLDQCVNSKSTWELLKPNLRNLVSHLIFPLLCQSDEDLEMFENEPSEYLHRKLNFYEEVTSPDVAATNFLVTLTKSRRRETFSILQFVNEVVTRYEAAPDGQKNAREKEGALRMIGTLSGVILGKKSPIADEVEYFFVRHVFPEFHSSHGFLRARACDTLEKFQALEFKDTNNLLIIYRNILECMADTELPVRVEAALALQPLIRHDLIKTNMEQNIPQIMQQLLKLANEVDVDALANVMEEFVEVFATQLTPFAVALSEQLRDTYLRIVRDILERQSTDPTDEPTTDLLDDKAITALGVLQTIGTLILTLESTPDVLLHLETTLMPIIIVTLENKLYDLFNEVFEIVDSCTFAAKAISPTMWSAFEQIHKTFKAGSELYLEDMLPALENFVTFGSETLIQRRDYLEAVVDMVRTMFSDSKVGGVDRICACKLAEAVMLSLRGHVDEHVPGFVSMAMTLLMNDEVKVKSLRIHLMEMVINAVYYNPQLALQTLEAQGWTNKFFSLWFSSIESFSRVHDKKLSIAAISSLLTLKAQEIPSSVQQGWPRLLQGIVRLFQTLPAALKNREEATKESDFAADEYGDEDEEEWEGDVDWSTEVDETSDVKDESAAYLEFLNEEAAKFTGLGDDDDDELEEESLLLETPLEKVEPYTMFKNALEYLHSEQPQLYESLIKALSPEEQQVLSGAIHQAGVIASQPSAPLQTNGSAH